MLMKFDILNERYIASENADWRGVAMSPLIKTGRWRMGEVGAVGKNTRFCEIEKRHPRRDGVSWTLFRIKFTENKEL